MKKTSPFDKKTLALFDLDGTLLMTRPTSLDALAKYGRALGLSFDKNARRAAIRWSHKYFASHDTMKGDRDRLGDEAFWENYIALQLKALGIESARRKKIVPQLSARFRKDFSPERYLEPGAKELLWNLREAGFKVGLVSNRSQPLTGIAIEMDIIEHFHFTLAAGQVNSWKPDPVIFMQALKLGGDAAPDEAIYIGDNYYADVVGARGAGISAVLLDEEKAFPEVAKECLVISKLSELIDAVPEKPVSKN